MLLISRPRRQPKQGLSLLELVAVVTLLGIIMAVSTVRYSRNSLGNIGARADAQKVSTGLMLARRQAIAAGKNHLLAFTRSGGVITGYQIYRRDSGLVAVGLPVEFQTDVIVTAAADPEFNFQGEALASYTIQLAGTQHIWRVSVNQVTGIASVTRVS